MKKKVFALLLSLLLSFGVMIACDEEIKPLAIDGFEVQESITVSYGESVEVEEPIVSDESGTVLDVWTEVTDSEGNFVEIIAGRFKAEHTGGYTITYVVRASDNYSYQKTTTVTVTGGPQSEITLTADYDKIIDIGSTVTINPVCSKTDATYTYTVLNGEQPVTVTDGSFVASEGGIYSVTIEVDGVEYSYEQVAIKPMQKGEVEVFDEYWQAKEKALGGSRQYDIVSSEESGIYDRFGREGTFATFTTSLQYPGFYIYPRGEKDYYQSLAEEGYTKVSYWIYMQSEKNISHITRVDRDPNGKYFMGGSSPALLPNTWVEVSINLVDSYADYNRSFVSCYDFYREGTMKYMLVDNGVDNSAGMGDTMTFYIADIYATKKSAPVVKEEITTTYKTGETLDFASVIDNPENYDFFVETRGETQRIDALSYKFTANGTYNLTIVNKTADLDGKSNITFTVTDDYKFTGNYPIVSRTSAEQKIALADFNAGFALIEGADGNLPTVENYAVSYNGTPVAIENGEFVALKDGSYDVEISGRYEKAGETYTSYVFATVDIYSEETKYSLLTVDRMVGVANSVSAARPVITEGVYEIGGREGNMIKVDRKHSATSLYFKPLFSKNYYEKLLIDEPSLYLNLEFYKDGSGSNHYQYCYLGQRNSNGYQWNSTSTTAWGTKRTLENFVANYDNFIKGYNAVNTAIATSTWYEGVTESDDAQNERLIYTWITDGAVDLYIDGLTLVKDATETTLALKSGATFNAEETYNVYDILDAKLDGLDAEIIRVEVKYNGEWMRLTESKSITPVWNCGYEFKITARANGLIGSTTAVINTSGEAVVVTDDTTYRELRADGSINIDEVINLPSYDLEYAVTKVVGTSEVATEVTIENGVLLGSNEYLEEGLYKITAWASKPEFEGNPFNNIAIYSLYVDFIESENSLILPENLTNELLNAYTWTNCEGNQPNAGMSARLEEYEEREVIAIGGNIKKYGWAWSVAPIHSKGYYEKLLTVSPDYAIMYEVLVATEFSSVKINNFGSYSVAGTEITPYTWNTVTIPLTKLIDNWTEAITHTYANWKKGSLYNTGWLNADSYDIPVISYIANIRFGYEATVSVEELELELGATYNLANELSAKINGENATVTKIELKDGDNWVAVPDITAFNSSWNVEYTARIFAQKGEASGVTTTTIKVVDGEGNTFAPVAVTSLNLINESNASINLSDTLDLPSDFTYTYTAQRITYKSGKVTATAPVVSGNLLSAGSDWTTGQYEITVVATVEGGLEPFNSLSYATFIVDYDETDEKVFIPEFTEEVLVDNTQLMNQWGTKCSYTADITDTTSFGGRVNDINLRKDKKDMWAIQIRPIHSKAYYEALVTQDADYKLYYDFYFEKDGNGSIHAHEEVFSPYVQGTRKGNTWNTVAIPLSAILEHWEGVSSTQDPYKYRIFSIEQGVNIYFGNIRLAKEVTPVAQTAEFTLGETYDLTNDLNITIDGVKATVLSVELNDGANWVAVPDLTAFNSSWNIEYTARASVKSDYKFGTVEFTIKVVDGEGNTFTPIASDKFVRLSADNSVSVSEAITLPAGNTYTYSAQKLTNGEYVVATAPVVENGNLNAGSDWTTGQYRVSVIATVEGGLEPFNTVSYATFALDYDETEAYEYIPTLTADNIRQHTALMNQWGTVTSYNATLVDNTAIGGTTNDISLRQESKDMWAIQVRPVHSKAYYEALVAENSNYALMYDFYATATNPNIHTQNFTDYVSGKVTGKQWNTISIPLTAILEHWDGVTSTDKTDAYLYRIFAIESSVNTYLSNFRIGYSATATVSEINLLAGETHNLTSEITATILEQSATIKAVDVKENGLWVRVPDMTALYTPFNLSYTARITSALSDGAEAVNEVTFNIVDGEGQTYETAINNSFNLITDDGTATVDLAFLNLPQDGAFTYTASKVIGADRVVATAPVVENGKLSKAEDWTVGAYEILVQIKDETAFAPISYMDYVTFTVDYDESENIKTYIKDLTQDTLQTYTLKYYNTGGTSNSMNYVNEGTYAGRTVINLFDNARRDNTGYQILPLHSKAYYEAILADNADAAIYYDIYIASTAATITYGTTGKYSSGSTKVAHPYEAGTAGTTNTWFTTSIPLSTLIEKWSYVSEFGNSSDYAWVHKCILTTGYHATKADFYLSNFHIGVETTEEVTATAQTLTLGNTYDLTQVITAKIGENNAIVTRVELVDGADYIEVPNNSFTPSWNITYTARVTALYDGAFGTAETTITVQDGEGNSFTPVANTDLHLITDDGTATVDLTTLALPTEYTYTYTAKRIIGANKVDATAPVIEGNTLAKASDWTAGAYEITATATKADGLAPFNSVAYATFIVDYDLSESTKIFVPDLTADTLADHAVVGLAGVVSSTITDKAVTFKDRASVSVNQNNSSSVGKYHNGLQIIPVHSKAYYEAIKDTHTFTYDLYFYKGVVDSEDSNGDGSTTDYVESTTVVSLSAIQVLNTAVSSALSSNQWNTITVPLESLIANWDSVTVKMSSENTSVAADYKPRSIFASGYHDSSYRYQFYVSNVVISTNA